MTPDYLPRLTLAQGLQSILKSYKLALASASGATAVLDINRVSASPPGSRAPRDFGSDTNEIEQIVSRVAHILTARFGTRPGQPKDQRPRKATREIVLAEVGRPAIEVGWLYGIREDYVERIRRAARLDPRTGEPLTDTPLTAT